MNFLPGAQVCPWVLQKTYGRSLRRIILLDIFRAYACLFDQFERWIYVILKHSLHSIDFIEKLKGPGCGKAGISNELADRIKVFLLHIAVIIFLSRTATGYLQIVLTVFDHGIVNKFRAVIRVDFHKRDGTVIPHQVKGFDNPFMGPVK